MALIVADRVQETSTTTGTGAITLAGAVTGFRTFGSVMVNTDTTYYTITDQTSSANWEVGLGTWGTGNVLTRTTILKSSNANAAVNFTSGALYVFMTYPADKAVYEDANNRVSGYVIDNSSIGSVTPSTGAFTTLNSTGVTQFQQLPVSPSQSSGQVSGFLSAISAAFASGGTTINDIDIDPENRFLYLAASGGLRSYSISALGVLTFVNNASSGTAGYIGVKIHPQGNFAYGTNNSQLILCSINATTGALTFSSTQATFGGGLRRIAISPNGNFLYVCHTTSGITPYSINTSTGALTAGTNIAFNSDNIVIDPTGRFLYASFNNVGGTIGQYSINQSTGALTVIATAISSSCTSIIADPTGKYLYTLAGQLDQYTINQSTGALTLARTVTDADSTYLTDDSAGFFLYTASFTDGSVRSYALNQSTGEPVLVTSATGSGASQTRGIAVNKNNRFLYVSNNTAATFNSFNCDTFPVDLSSPPAIGSTTPNSGAFTTLSATGSLTASAQDNTISGFYVGRGRATAYATAKNVYIGTAPVSSNTGSDNFVIGSNLPALTSGSANIFIGGGGTGSQLTTGSNNVAVGSGNLNLTSTGSNNVAVGNNALANNSASFNVGVGASALTGTSVSGNNTAVGQSALSSITGASATQNTSVGAFTATNLTSGSDNVFVGYNAGTSITTGSSNVYVGSGITGPAGSTGVTVLGQITTPSPALNNNEALIAAGGTEIVRGSGTLLTAPGKVRSNATTSGSSNTGAFNYGTLGFSDQNTLASFQSSVNNYNQLVVQNTSNGSAASADLTICNDVSTASAFYANFGINSSGWGGTLGTNSLNAPSVTYLTATSADLVLGTTTSNSLRFVVGGGADVLTVDTAGDFGFGVTTPGATLHIRAGTAAAGTAPIKLNSGTLMTAAETGAVEYDGKLKYFTPASTARALIPTSYYYRKNTATVLASNTNAQSWLGLTNGVTLQASTIYLIDGEFELTTTGATSHTEAIGFTLTTATLSAATGIGVSRRAVQTAVTSVTTGYITSTASGTTVITGAITTSQTVLYTIRGVFCVNAGGQANPVIQFSAGPGGTSTIIAGAWISFTPIGTTGSNVSIGTWA
jgi:6-phosphogluconolactonase (cycloisomerase 2 family)